MTSKDKDGQKEKRAYQRPQILSRESLEISAAVCAGFGSKEPSNGACTGPAPQSS
ncbi:MAG: hypothetical protein LJE84_00290 [Gammaproteobacteria bacterium]|nr:hypothetical protein [Gammaproteobacteria bacterium]